MASQMFSSLDEVMTQFGDTVKEMQRQFKDIQRGKDPLTLLREFVGAIDWSERWIQAIVVLHLALLATTIWHRRNMLVQLTVFTFGATVIFMAEPLNALGAEYWEEFARQPYFDKRGAFYSGVVSLPLVVILLIVLVNLVSATIEDMVFVKRRQAMARARRAQGTKLE